MKKILSIIFLAFVLISCSDSNESIDETQVLQNGEIQDSSSLTEEETNIIEELILEE